MRTGRPVLSPLLVGRDEPLAIADEAVARASAGHGSSLLLAGEPGIGKTRLLAAIKRKAEAAGLRIATGDLAPDDRELPLASVRDLTRAMDQRGFGVPIDDVLGPPEGSGGDALGARRLVVRTVTDRLAAAIDRPTLLAFEDLQWADELSLEVVGELSRRAGSMPLLVVGSYRVDEWPPGAPQRGWRSRILTQRHARELRLRPLTRDETALVTTLIAGDGLPAPRDVVDAVFERTDGIPLHVEELLAALTERARLDGRTVREAQVPSSIEDAILDRAERLSDEARAAARAGAVIGRCFDPEVLAGILNRPLGDLEGPLDELVRAAFLYPFAHVDRGYYDFRHQLLRDALYATVPPSELRRLHARAAEFGSRLIGTTEVHASVHYERAGMRAEAYRAAIVAAEAASAVSSRREAHELYRRAVANAPDDLADAELAALYDHLSIAASAIDDVEGAMAADETARAHFLAAGDSLMAAAKLVDLAAMWRRDLRSPDGIHALLDQAVNELERCPSGERRAEWLGDATSLRAVTLLDEGRLDEAAIAIAAAAAHYAAAPSADASSVELVEAMLAVLAGRVTDGLERLFDLAGRGRDRRMEVAGVTAFRSAAALAARTMAYGVARAGTAEGLRYADEIEQSYCRHSMAVTSAQVAWAEGSWDEAVGLARAEVVERASRRVTTSATHVLGLVAALRGDGPDAAGQLEEALAVGHASGAAEFILPPLWGLAEAALAAGDPDLARERCNQALEVARRTNERALLVPFVVTGVRAAHLARRPTDADQWLADVAGHLAGWEPVAGAALPHAEGLVRMVAGATGLARPALEAAVAGWDERGRAWESTWARVDLARCLVRSNRPVDALRELAGAQPTAARLGSPSLLAEIELVTAQARGRAAGEDPWHPLTAREFEVARAIAEGLTNAQIGESLGIAPKTASAHVEHILAKLGVGRRTEIAAWVAQVAQPAASTAGSPGPARDTRDLAAAHS